jgi:hypothetical protein
MRVLDACKLCHLGKDLSVLLETAQVNGFKHMQTLAIAFDKNARTEATHADVPNPLIAMHHSALCAPYIQATLSRKAVCRRSDIFFPGTNSETRPHTHTHI